MNSQGRLFPVVVAAAFVLAACSSADPTALSDPTPTSTAPNSVAASDSPQPPSKSVLPAVSVLDVANGDDFELASLVPSQTPILLWAWAPHCSICAGEAPGVEEFAKANTGTVSIVGIGTQDSLGEAESFVSTYGVKTPQMLWDPGFESWSALKITGQPTWVLVSSAGEELGRWQGGLPTEEILAAVA